MNEHDTAKMRLMLEGLGYASADTPEGADLVLVNTCTIREKAHHKAVSELGRSRDFKRVNPGCLVGVCGCVAQQEGAALLERFPGVDFAFGPDQIPQLPRLIAEAEQGKRGRALDLIDDPARYVFLDQTPLGTTNPSTSLRTGDERRTTSFVSIMKGCDCACSYCIVPSVRGREVCRDPDAIVDEVRCLVALGTKEVVLLGQRVNAYRFQGPGIRVQGSTTSFPELLRRVAEETDVARIRFTSPHPGNVDDALIAAFATNPKLMPHLHLPVQSGSKAILKRMRRGSTRERVLEICEELRTARPGMAISTDLIVGFCGETEEDFEETLELMRRVRFDSFFAFQYSPRPGTEAARCFDDDIPAAEKGRRLAELFALGRRIAREANEARVGECDEALVTGSNRQEAGALTGRLPDNRIIHFPGQPAWIGDRVPVRITGAHDNSLAGEALR